MDDVELGPDGRPRLRAAAQDDTRPEGSYRPAHAWVAALRDAGFVDVDYDPCLPERLGGIVTGVRP